jgi:hypothetical protein
MNDKIDLTLLQALLKQKDAEILALKEVIKIGTQRFETMRKLFNLCIDWKAIPDVGKIIVENEIKL